MRSAALREALLRGAEGFPVLDVDWAARGLSLGHELYAPMIVATALGQVAAVTKPGGWDPITYGSGIARGSLEAVLTAVSVSDPAGDLLRLLETYDPRGSVARIHISARGLVDEDWEPLFTGLVSDWARETPYTKLILKTDDTPLRRPIPGAVFQRTEWSAAAEASIFGTPMPLVTGVHSSWAITARGMVPAVNVVYDETLGYWWLASVDQMVVIDRVYFDGVPQGAAGWSVRNVVRGGSRCTLIVIEEGSQPGKGVVVSFDGQGPDENGLTAGGPLTGAPDTLRAIIEEYGYRNAPLNGWRGPSTICEGDSWDVVSEWFALHRIEAARRFGGDQQPESLAEVIDSFLAAYPWARIWWTELGQLAIGVIDPDDVDPDDGAWLDLQLHHEGGQVPFEPGDLREVYTHVKQPYLWSAAEQKFMSAYEAHDVAALDEKVELSYDNIWSQARYAQDGPALNPAAPADPEIPS